MKNLISIFLCLLLGSQIIAQKTRYNLMFTKGQTELNDNQKEELKKIITWIKPKQTISIFPLTFDVNYDRLYFPRNAKDQALWIATYAKTLGYEVTGIPKNFPTSYKGLSVSVNASYNIPIPKNELSDLFPEKPSQFFIIDPTKDTLIIGAEGTKLLFEAGSLLSTKKVSVELKEFYALADLIKSGLPTSSNGKFIETGGSIYLNTTDADNKNQQVAINQNKGVAIDFTLGKNDPDMEIFIKDPRYPNQMNWIRPRVKRTSSVKKSWQMTETIYNADKTLRSKQVFNSKEEWEAHLKKQQEAKEKKKKDDAIRQKVEVKMDSKLKTYDLGYINCDKFPNEDTAPLIVTADEKTSAAYYLVFTEVRGVMQGRVNNNKVQFGKVPTNKKAELVAVSFIDKQAYYFKCTLPAGSKTAPKITLAPVEESFLNAQLALLK